MSANATILGNTGRDVELRYLPDGTPVANFSLASNTVRGSGENQQKKTDWFNISAFGKQAETLAKYLEKGSQVLVRGKLTFNPWLDRDGKAQVSADVLLQDFEFVGSSSFTEEQKLPEKEAISPSKAASLADDEEEKAEILAELDAM